MLHNTITPDQPDLPRLPGIRRALRPGSGGLRCA